MTWRPVPPCRSELATDEAANSAATGAATSTHAMEKDMRTRHSAMSVVLSATLVLVGCGKESASGSPVAPDNSPVIASVQIGQQVWMSKNLDVTMDASGSPLSPIAYSNDQSLVSMYGRLYTHAEALRACPSGWHLPSSSEWQALFTYLGGIDVAGGRMKTAANWNQPNEGASNSSGFGALPAGGCASSSQCDGLGWAAHFWSSTAANGTAQAPSLMNNLENAYILDLNRAMRASVRCVHD